MPATAETATLEERVRAVEGRTGVQVVVAGVERADVYHGLRWRAFAAGAVLAGPALMLGTALRPGLLPATPAAAAFGAVALVLGAGCVLALAATLSRPFARLFLEPLRAETELRQCAESLFLERGLFATRGRTAVLLLAGRFERRAVALPDTGFRGRVAESDWEAVGAAAEAGLRDGSVTDGLLAGLASLERLLLARGFAPGPGEANELPDTPVAEGGHA